MHVIIAHETLPIPGKNRPTLVIYSLYSSPNSEELSRDSHRDQAAGKRNPADQPRKANRYPEYPERGII